MELRFADPKSLKFNPHNPRRTAAPALSDEQLTANIRQIGLLQPPLTREQPDGVMVVVGERRVRCSIAAEQAEIPILVVDSDATDDAVRALSENVQRANMNPIDQWRAIEAAISDRWSEEAIACAMGLPVRTIRKLRLLAHIHPAMLDQMARGDMPSEQYLRTIAAAPREDQASVWKKHKPKKGQASVGWWEVARALEKRRLKAAVARFGADEAEAFGIVWEEDLFEQAGKENRYTTQVDAFLAAQQAWLEANLPKNGVILTANEYGQSKLPPKAQRSWGQPRKGDTIGCFVDPRTGEIEEIPFRLAEAHGKSGAADTDAADTTPPRTRPEITRKGVGKIGDMRTVALHQAIGEAAIDDGTLLALLVLALAGGNVTVLSPHGGFRDDRFRIAESLVAGRSLTQDAADIRRAARAMLAEVLSCREGATNSGVIAQLAGDAIGADAYLPTMATEDFLSCLSKAGIESAARIANVLPRQRAKDTRAALIEQVGQGTYILPAARFAPSDAALAKLLRPAAAGAPEGGTSGVDGNIDGEAPSTDGALVDEPESPDEQAAA